MQTKQHITKDERFRYASPNFAYWQTSVIYGTLYAMALTIIYKVFLYD